MRVSAITTTIAIGLLGVAGVRDAKAQQPPPIHVRVTPTQHAPYDPAVFPTALRDTCLNPTSWPTGWARMELFSNGLGFFGQLATNERVQCFNNLHADGKMLAFGVAALKEWCTTAQACWDAQSGEILQYYNEGAPLEYLILDEPLSALFDHTDTYTVDQTAEFVRLARQTYPNIKIILQEAYPHQPATTLMNFFRDVNTQTTTLTGWGIQYAELDHDWNDPHGTLIDLINIQDSVRGNGMYFSSIYWNADPNRSWYDGLMHQGQMYLDWSRYGLNPDMSAVDNWTSSPSTTLPETTNGTFTRSVRDFVNTYTPTPTGSFGLRPNEILSVGDSRPSIDGRFLLVYQGDGNLVLYDDGAALWASNTNGTSPNFVVMQGDGNLVIYDANGTPVWASNTSGHPGAYLIVQRDGNVVVYQGGYAQWATNTNYF
jgi:hypothetical protein